MELPDKRQVLDALIQSLTASLAHVAQSAEDIRKDATHSEARPENDKDTRALEQTYLARGQAIRAEAMVEQLHILRSLDLSLLSADQPIRAGALIGLEDESATRCLFMAPFGGGAQLVVDGTSVQVITPTSGMGGALLGKREGDDIEVRLPSGPRDYTIVAVR
jgi:hypothetical protein